MLGESDVYEDRMISICQWTNDRFVSCMCYVLSQWCLWCTGNFCPKLTLPVPESLNRSCSASVKGREGKCTAGAWLLHDFCMSGYWQGYMHMMQATIWSSKTSSFWWQNGMSSFTWRLCFLVFLGSNLAMLQPGRNLEVQSLSVDGGARGALFLSDSSHHLASVPVKKADSRFELVPSEILLIDKILSPCITNGYCTLKLKDKNTHTDIYIWIYIMFVLIQIYINN